MGQRTARNLKRAQRHCNRCGLELPGALAAGLFLSLSSAFVGMAPAGSAKAEMASLEPLDVAGFWLTPDGSSTVEIFDCGNGTPCGVVVAIDRDRGGMVCDEKNRNRALRGRDMVGITLLDGFRSDRGIWRAGDIYNPHDGRTYRARLRLVEEDRLSVSGCLGPICKDLIWERASTSDLDGIREGKRAAL